MAAFACAALALAITGIHAVVAYSVSQRGREIGIRVALGATRAHIVRLVAGQGLRFIALGLAAEIALAMAAARLVSATLFGVTASDPVTLTQVTIVVALLSAIACAVPTARAGSVPGVLNAE